MLTLPIYRDEACTNLFESIPIRDLPYTGFSTPPYTIYIGAKPYPRMLYSSGSFKYLEGVGLYTDDRSAAGSRRIPGFTSKTGCLFYVRNGLKLTAITVQCNLIRSSIGAWLSRGKTMSVQSIN